MAVTPPHWTLVATDLAATTVYGEITNADELQVVNPLNRVPTLACKIPLAHPLANTLIGTDCLIKAYRWDRISASPVLAFHGPVLSTEEVADSDNQSIAVNAVGPLWRLTKRLLGTNKAGISFGTSDSLLEVTTIAKSIVDVVNTYTDSGGGHPGFTGINVGAVTQNTPPNMTKVGPYSLKNAAEALAELAASVNGYDYTVAPTEATSTGFTWPQIGVMQIAPMIGQNRPDAMFEYGSGQANLSGYDRMVTRENMMTQGYITAPGWPDATALDLIEQHDSVQLANRGMFEDSINDGGVADNTARGAMLGEHLYYRKIPREIINVTTAVNARPWPYTDFTVGDTVRARATVHGNLRFDAMFRIWGTTIAVDKNGNETVTLELVMP